VHGRNLLRRRWRKRSLLLQRWPYV
jgi:hypothetical protein